MSITASTGKALREPGALDKLSAEEWNELLALWREVEALLSRMASP